MKLAAAMAVSALSAVGAISPATSVAAGNKIADTAQGGNWLSYGRTYDEQRYSPLTQINTSSVQQLGLAWSFEMPKRARALEGTPLAIDGVLYFTSSMSVVYAVRAVDGKVLWEYDPQAWIFNPQALRTLQGYNRGLAYWEGSLFLGSCDGHLIALDAKTGKVQWSVLTVETQNSRKQISGAPRAYNGKIIIGHAGADVGTRGYVTAYEAKTGKQLWRFYTVPGNPANGFEDSAMAMAATTWSGQWWRWGGGGTVWNAITFDPEFNRIYIGTGNSSNYNPQSRSPGGGDNLFLASIVALDADTGKYIWHYQVNPREAWDFKATADMVLADLTIDGMDRKVLMQSPTNGFFYVLDRRTGKLISAEKTGKVTWAERIDLATGRPVEAPNLRYEKGAVQFWPSPWGTHNWQAMSFSPRTGLVYIPYMQLGGSYNSTAQDLKDAENMTVDKTRYWFPIGGSFGVVVTDEEDGKGQLVAWDPVLQKARWRVQHPMLFNGGTLVTAGDVVFQGTADGWLYAYDARNGSRLWAFDAHNGIVAPPITFQVGDAQYVSVLVGYGGSTAPGGKIMDPGWRYGEHLPRALTFVLGGKAVLPKSPGPDFAEHILDDETFAIDESQADQGERRWDHTCILCHGLNAGQTAGSNAPDLRGSPLANNFEAFKAVLGGALKQNGMPPFDELSPKEARELFMYIRRQARASRENLLESTGNAK
jgi:quinohemoprotein ethanol dehydrogenase